MNEERPKVGVAAIVRKGDTVLLGKRIGSHGNGDWGFPGGHLEFGESIENCARRETLEETGLLVGNIRIGTLTNDIFEKEGKHYITIFTVADYTAGKPELREPEKLKEWKWFKWRELPPNLFLPIRHLLEQKFDPFK